MIARSRSSRSARPIGAMMARPPGAPQPLTRGSRRGTTRAAMKNETPLSAAELAAIDGYWRAANYLSVGQIYLLANPLLKEPLRREHVKPRLLGHFGTTPGLNLVYAHMNRAIRVHDLDAMYVIGPGHGGRSEEHTSE